MHILLLLSDGTLWVPQTLCKLKLLKAVEAASSPGKKMPPLLQQVPLLRLLLLLLLEQEVALRQHRTRLLHCLPLTHCRAVCAGAVSGRPQLLRGPCGGAGGLQVGHGVQHRLDHQGGHGGVQAAGAGLRHACHQCE